MRGPASQPLKPVPDIIDEEENAAPVKDPEEDFDEDFGRRKMEQFKAECRLVLGRERRPGNPTMFDEPLQESEVMGARDYDAPLDIVSAYKHLKQAISKPATVHNASGKSQRKGYLKMTIAAQQHSKNSMNKDLLEYSFATSKH